MAYRKLLWGVAVAGLLAGAVPAQAQQYFSPFRQSEKPSVEIDLSVIGEDAAPPARRAVKPLPAAKPKTILADYSYVRSHAFEGDERAPAAGPEPLPPQEVAPVAAVPPSEAASENAKAVAVGNEAAPPKPPKSAKAAEKKALKKKRPALIVTDTPVTEAMPAPAASSAAAPIISRPPVEAPLEQPVQHQSLNAAAPIISNPPDANVPPVAPPAPAAVKPAPASPIVSAPEYVRAAAPVPSAVEPLPAMPATPMVEVAPAPVSTPARPSAMPEDRPAPAPLPDITVVHEPDNMIENVEPVMPEIVTEPELDALPSVKAAKKKAPREEPPVLPHKTAGEARTPPAGPAPQLDSSSIPSIASAPPIASTPAVDIAPAEPEPQGGELPLVPAVADLTLHFIGNSSDLSSDTQKKLDSIAKQLRDMTDGRLQVRGFAAGEDGSSSSARRIALSRALSVRSYLMDKGIKPTRIDVRAMGAETDRSPLDRVDVIFVR